MKYKTNYYPSDGPNPLNMTGGNTGTLIPHNMKKENKNKIIPNLGSGAGTGSKLYEEVGCPLRNFTLSIMKNKNDKSAIIGRWFDTLESAKEYVKKREKKTIVKVKGGYIVILCPTPT